jgi:hypothetical protein
MGIPLKLLYNTARKENEKLRNKNQQLKKYKKRMNWCLEYCTIWYIDKEGDSHSLENLYDIDCFMDEEINED